MVEDKLLEYLSRGEIPPALSSCYKAHSYEKPFKYWRSVATTEYGMWAIVDKQWTKDLATWIDDRVVLEVMAGAGWLAKALAQHGCTVLSTDSNAWYEEGHAHQDVIRVHSVEIMDGLTAVKTYPMADVLIVSWPPYNDTAIMDICQAWGCARPIVYIGEEYGCNAPEEFFDLHFYPMKGAPDITLPQWYGMHDKIFIGYYH